ncbi:hypothetical protein F4679DRAFT_588206 [Xylaria curta]|nr:hypothetical protein F4679DRAFT_588206 [Xylaria curta]
MSSATISILVEWMMKSKDSLDYIDHHGRTLLYYAAERVSFDTEQTKPDSEIIRNLPEEGSNANGVDPRGRPLIVATRQGKKDIADPKLPDENGRAPLYWAARAGRQELAKHLEEPITEPAES